MELADFYYNKYSQLLDQADVALDVGNYKLHQKLREEAEEAYRTYLYASTKERWNGKTN